MRELLFVLLKKRTFSNHFRKSYLLCQVIYMNFLKEINPEYSLKGLMLKLEAPVFWPPDEKSWLIRNDPDAGKDWRQEEKGTTEDKIVGWHHWLNGHKFEQAPGDGERQGNLACYNPWGHKESDTTEHLNNNIWIGQCVQLCSEFGYLIIILKKTLECFPIYLILSLLTCYIWDKITSFAFGEL